MTQQMSERIILRMAFQRCFLAICQQQCLCISTLCISTYEFLYILESVCPLSLALIFNIAGPALCSLLLCYYRYQV